MSALKPDTDDTHDLGSSALRWRNLYVHDIDIATNIATAGSFIFEGGTADAHETTFGVVDPTADRAINLPNQSGTIPVLAAVSATAITATPEELNIIDGGTSATGTTLVAADRVVVNDNGTMVQVAMSDFETFMESNLDTLTLAISITDATNATTVSDGSLSLAGGLSVAANKDVVLGGDLKLLTDDSVLSFGSDNEVKLTHSDSLGGLILTNNGETATPVFELKNTNADGTGGTLKFNKDGASVVDGDVVGNIDFTSEDDADNEQVYARINSTIDDASSGAEQGGLDLYVAANDGTLAAGLQIQGTTSAGVVDVTVGLGAASTVTIPGNLTVSGTTTHVDTENLQVKDKNILINDGGSTANTTGAGLDIEGDGASVVGYMRVGSGDNANLEFKAPGNAGVLTLDINATKTLTVAGALNVEADSIINQDLSTNSTAAQLATLTISTSLLPDASGGADIGSVSAEFGDIYVGDSKSLKLGEGQDVTISHDGGTGLDVTSAGDLDIKSTAGSITLGASLADGQTLKLGKTGAVETTIAPHGTPGSENYSVINTSGTTDGADAAGAILLSSVAGGIGLAWADGKDLWAEGGRAVITANEDAADAIKLHADAGTSQTIQIVNDEGTVDGTDDAGAIELSAAAGGIGLAWADNKDLWAEGGRAVITANENAADAIKLHADAGALQTIQIVNDEGTVESAIALTSTAGGVDIDAAAAKDVNIAGGQVALSSKDDAASAIALTANQGSSETIVITNTQGVTENLDVELGQAAIQLTASAGGIGLTWNDGKDLWAEGGRAVITANENAADAIKLHADAGTSQTITLLNDAGTNAAAIGLTATAGGITLSATDTSNGKVTVDSDTVTFGSSNSTNPLVSIKNTTNDANGARLRFVKDKGAAGAADDVAGLIEFYADDAAQDQVMFGEIKSQVAVHTNGQEGGKLTLSVASHDGESQPGLVIQDGSAEDEVDVFIGNGSDSVTTIRGDLVVSGTTTTVNSTTITVDDKNIELGSVDTPSDTTADGGGITLKGATDKTFNWVNSSDSWTSSEHIEIASGKAYYINGVAMLDATTLHANVTSAAGLTTVSALATGSITTGFGAIDNGTSNITTGGLLKIDVDGTAVGEVGSLTLGAGSDAGLYVTSDDFVIQNVTIDKDILIKGNDGGTSKTILTIDSSAPSVIARGGLTVTNDADIGGETKLLEIDPDESSPFHVTAASKITGALIVTGRVTGQDIVVLSDTAQTSDGVATPVTNHATWYQTGGAETSTLAAGTEGQIKVLAMHTDGGDMVVTVANAIWGSTITLSAVGQACTLQYINSKWFCIGNNGATFG